MKRTAPLVLFISITTMFFPGPSHAYQPVLHEKETISWSRVMGPLTGNPIVGMSGDLVNGEVLRTRLSDIPRWIVSGDLDSNGDDEAIIMFDDGTLRTVVLERGSLRTKYTVVGLDPRVPPVVLTVDTPAAERGIIGIDDRGDLVSIRPGSGSSKRVSDDGFSRVTYPVAADLDGDGEMEILAVSDEGYLTVILGRGRANRKRERRTEIFPASRIAVGDLNGDGHPEVVALTRPTDEVDLGRLGVEKLARGVAVFTWDGKILDLEDEFKLRSGEVFEQVTPILADVGRGEGDEIILTVSRADEGSELVILSYSGKRLHEIHRGPSDRKDRFVQVVGASEMGNSGRKLILAVAGPTDSGDLEAFRTDLAATRITLDDEISTHIEGTIILEMALIGDFNGDGQRELLAPDESKEEISLFQLRKNRFREIVVFTGNRAVSSNLCPGDFNGDGKVDVAVGFEDGTLIFILGK